MRGRARPDSGRTILRFGCVVTTKARWLSSRLKNCDRFENCPAVFPDACGIPKSQAVSIGELVVEENEGGLTVRTRDGRLQFDIIEAFANILAPLVVNSFKVLLPHPHTPRVTVDRLVIHREAWGSAPAEIPFAYQKTEADRFVAARRWARAQGMPRYTFVKAPVEIKPSYVDFDSPIYVEIFAKTVRRSGEANLAEPLITVTEIPPGRRALWLQGAEGQSYTSEFRLVALDLATWTRQASVATTARISIKAKIQEVA